MTKRKTEAAAGSPSKKRRENKLTNYYGPPVQTASHVGLQSFRVDDATTSAPKEVYLSEDQIQVYKAAVHDRKSIFFTGPAGSGKSLLTQAIITGLKSKHKGDPDAVAVTASTGIAAANIKGTTLHAWTSFKASVRDAASTESILKKIPGVARRWRNVKVIVLDEVSMIEAATFDQVDGVGKIFRNAPDQPFGGIQLVVTGDFFQLPPVHQGKGEVPWAFKSRAWKEGIQESFVLKKVFRQKDDAFVNLLNEVRIARLSPATVATIRSLSRPLPDSDDSCPPTELYPKRSQVDDANEVHLRRLDGPSHHYEARDGGSANDEERARLLKSFMAPALLELKVGAQVMLVKNVDAARGLCNGAIGVVTAFRHAPSGPDFRSAASDYAVSGTELIKVDGGRVRKGKAFSGHSSELFPVVRFFLHSGISTVLVKKDEFTAEDKNGRVLARRVQVPLALSWAISIHKSQGQTLQRVIVDVNAFAPGQVYVALSRASSLEGLQVKSFSRDKIVADRYVQLWHEELLENATSAEGAGPSGVASSSAAAQ